MLKNNKKGFSLVELIVVIAIMAVLMAILVPSLLRNVERSRMQRDDSAMSEVVESVKLALCDFDTYDEAYEYAAEGNYLTYTDSSGVYGQRMMDEERWTPDGSGKCLTITFNPDENGTYDIAKCRINDMGGTTATLVNQCDFEEMGTEHRLFYNMKQVIGPTLQNISATYRHSSYTIFIVFDGPTSVYGQWNGTNLDDNSSDDEQETPSIIPPSEEEHTHTEEVKFINATCTEYGYLQVICSECGKILRIDAEISPHGHNWEDGKCVFCGEIKESEEEHTHTEVVNIIPETCTEYGYNQVICSECGKILRIDAEIPPHGHNYQIGKCVYCGDTQEHTHTQVAYDIGATCTEHGSHTVECSECGEQLSYKITPPLGHNYQISNISTGPNGEELVTYVCTRCSASYVDTFPASGS